MHGSISGGEFFALIFGGFGIPLGAILAAVFAAIAYRKRALKRYWFVILFCYFVPWLMLAASDTGFLKFFRDLYSVSGAFILQGGLEEPSMLWYSLPPLIGVALIVAGYFYFARHRREATATSGAHLR